MGISGMIRSKKNLVYNVAHVIYDVLRYAEYGLIYGLLRPMPLRNKVVASAFNGQKYGDNAKFILEKLHELDPGAEIVWLCDPAYSYDVPEYVRLVQCSSDKKTLVRIYHYATAKIWLNTHLYDKYLIKRKGQMVIETWHGGLGIKKIEGDVDKFHTNRFQMGKIAKTSRLADMFVSNSDFLSDIYRRAFFYRGDIQKVGFPKNDLLLKDSSPYRERVRAWFKLPQDRNIVVYAPTYRGEFEDSGQLRMEPYNIDLNRTVALLEQTLGGDWTAIVRWHPSMEKYIPADSPLYSERVINGSSYPEMQEIIAASDAFISDYSSCLFEAALKRIPCFIYANDYDAYLGDRGAYFTLDQLPFPHAADMDGFSEIVRQFDLGAYLVRWDSYCEAMGLFEHGNAAEQVAKKMEDFLKS